MGILETDTASTQAMSLKSILALCPGTGYIIFYALSYRALSHDVTAAILVFQTNPVGVKTLFLRKSSYRC